MRRSSTKFRVDSKCRLPKCQMKSMWLVTVSRSQRFDILSSLISLSPSLWAKIVETSNCFVLNRKIYFSLFNVEFPLKMSFVQWWRLVWPLGQFSLEIERIVSRDGRWLRLNMQRERERERESMFEQKIIQWSWWWTNAKERKMLHQCYAVLLLCHAQRQFSLSLLLTASSTQLFDDHRLFSLGTERRKTTTFSVREREGGDDHFLSNRHLAATVRRLIPFERREYQQSDGVVVINEWVPFSSHR